MNKVGVVTAYVPLKVRHLTESQYHQYGRELANAVSEAGALYICHKHPIEQCWLHAENPPLVPATATYEDRYAGPAEHVASHIVQHNRTTWALAAAEAQPDIDVWVWLDYGVFKQGAWNGFPVRHDDVVEFLGRVARTEDLAARIPFPGIEPMKPVDTQGHNWRFCGSTHVWPVGLLPAIDGVYKDTLRKWIAEEETVPLDLPIWALVEQMSGLPFEWYGANYDRTQFTNYPHGRLP